MSSEIPMNGLCRIQYRKTTESKIAGATKPNLIDKNTKIICRKNKTVKLRVLFLFKENSKHPTLHYNLILAKYSFTRANMTIIIKEENPFLKKHTRQIARLPGKSINR